MFKVICSISLLLSSVCLSACGQSGALQLPSDPNFDQRAKYLLYKNEASQHTDSAHEQSNITTEFEMPASSPASP